MLNELSSPGAVMFSPVLWFFTSNTDNTLTLPIQFCSFLQGDKPKPPIIRYNQEEVSGKQEQLPMIVT